MVAAIFRQMRSDLPIPVTAGVVLSRKNQLDRTTEGTLYPVGKGKNWSPSIRSTRLADAIMPNPV
jgi:hypothetical protein